MLLQSYITYFETIAAQHNAIAHVPASLSGDVATGSCKFATYNATDVLLKNMRTRVGFPALLAEVYEWDLSGKDIYDYRAHYRGAFSIVLRAPANNAPAEVEALKTAETILTQIIHRIYQDHYGPEAHKCNTPFQFIDIARAETMPFGPIWDNVFGWRFEFTFRPRPILKLNTPLPPEVWPALFPPPPPPPDEDPEPDP